jgi:hypothetical protein
MTRDGSEQVGGPFWAALAARALHPAHVEIIEAMRWIDRSLTATDLVHVFEGQRVGLRIERRLRQLARLDAVALDDSGRGGGAAMMRSYRLVKQPKT